MPPKTERFEMRMDLETLQRIDEWRRIQPDIPTRTEAIRRLLDFALRAKGRGAQSPLKK